MVLGERKMSMEAAPEEFLSLTGRVPAKWRGWGNVLVIILLQPPVMHIGIGDFTALRSSRLPCFSQSFQWGS